MYNSTVVEVEICDDGVVYISHNGSSGAQYEVTDARDIGEAVEDYIKFNFLFD